MKTFRLIFVSFALILVVSSVYGQDEIPEKVLVGIGVQYNLPARYFNNDISKFDDRNAGLGFYAEPKLLKCNFLFGLKAEYALVQENAKTDAIRIYDIVSLSPSVKYLFLKRQNTPYIGFGTGMYYVSYVGNNLNWGIEPSAGYLYHKLQLSLNYNLILNKVDYLNRGGFGNYYLALKLGVEL